MSIGDYIPSVGEKFIFLGVKEEDESFGPWGPGKGNEGQIVKVVRVSTYGVYHFEISLPDYVADDVDVDDEGEEIPRYSTFLVNKDELGFLQVKPLEHWE